MKKNLLIPVLSAALVCTSTFPACAQTVRTMETVEVDDVETGNLNTNLDFRDLPASYKFDEGGVTGKGAGDQFLYSNTKGDNFIYEADVKFNDIVGCASLVFRADRNHNSYVANLNGQSARGRIFKFDKHGVCDLGPEGGTEVTEDGVYHLKVVAIDDHILYYVNDTLMVNSADYTMSNGHYGQNDSFSDGYFGLLTFEGNVTYQNIKYTPITDENTPELKDLSVESIGGSVDKQISFYKGQYVYISYVSEDTEAVKIKAKSDNGSTVKAYDEYDNPLDINNIPVSDDQQIITVKSEKDGAEVVYRIKLHRCQSADSYYNEKWRGQYHYSVKDGWANDPNGMVYYKGKWHLYYQYFDDCKWGPMHWAHATSTDRLHWEEHPITVYPDEYGTMFSGCAVVADHETAPDIFKNEGEEGIVYFITANGENGNDDQKIIAAYSKDGEKITKYKDGKVLIHYSEDVLKNKALRDPKVFRYNNKWFMVLAGGPLRIYSSDNLVDWKAESAYPELNTECPDLFPAMVEDENGNETGEVKWVLSRGGRKYKIGDFREVDGKYAFVPLEQYESTNANGMGNEENDGVMNFGYDSYAAMTYYMGDFGTADDYNKDVIRKISAINWMNTWEGGFCNSIPDKNGNKVFNGTFNLQLDMKIKKNADGMFLVQTPIDEYKELEDKNGKVEVRNLTLSSDDAVLDNFKGTSYVLRCHIKPNDSNEVGIKVRTGKKHETVIKYLKDKNKLFIDRTKSGVTINRGMSKVNHDIIPNEDGSVDLTIYVDRSSVEVFNKDNTVEGALQIFPEDTDNGIKLYSDGAAEADITVTPMKSIWNNANNSNNGEEEPTDPSAETPAEPSKNEAPSKNEVPETNESVPMSSNEKIVKDTISSNDHVVEIKYNSTPAYTGAKLKAADFIKEFVVDGTSVKPENIKLKLNGEHKVGDSVKAEISSVKGLSHEVNKQLKGLDIAQVKIRAIKVSGIVKWDKKYKEEGQIVVKKNKSGIVTKVQVIVPKDGAASQSGKAKRIKVSKKSYKVDSASNTIEFDGTILSGTVKM